MTVSPPARGPAIGGALAIVGSVMALVGTTLPWLQLSGGLAAAGTDTPQLGFEFDDGKIFVFVALITIVATGCFLGARWLPEGPVTTVNRLLGNGAALSILAGSGVSIFSVLQLRDISNFVDAQVGGGAAVGIGIYLDLAAGAVILVGAAISLLSSRNDLPDR